MELREKVIRGFLMVVIKTTLWTVGVIVLLKLGGHSIVHTPLGMR